MTYDRCFFVKPDGEQCKRRILVERGCKFFCWQHTEQLGGNYDGLTCNDPKLPKCKSCSEENTTYPCKKKLTVFASKQLFDEYCTLRKNRPSGKYERDQRSEMAKIYNEKLEREGYYGNYDRKVKFKD